MLKCCGLRHDLVWLEWLHIYLPICNVLFDALDHGCLIFRMVGYILKMKFYYFHKLGIFASRPAFPDCVLQSHIGPSRCLLTQEVTVHINLEYPGYNVLLLEIYVHISVLETLRWFSMKELYFITFNQSFHCFFFERGFIFPIDFDSCMECILGNGELRVPFLLQKIHTSWTLGSFWLWNTVALQLWLLVSYMLFILIHVNNLLGYV